MAFSGARCARISPRWRLGLGGREASIAPGSAAPAAPDPNPPLWHSQSIEILFAGAATRSRRPRVLGSRALRATWRARPVGGGQRRGPARPRRRLARDRRASAAAKQRALTTRARRRLTRPLPLAAARPRHWLLALAAAGRPVWLRGRASARQALVFPSGVVATTRPASDEGGLSPRAPTLPTINFLLAGCSLCHKTFSALTGMSSRSPSDWRGALRGDLRPFPHGSRRTGRMCSASATRPLSWRLTASGPWRRTGATRVRRARARGRGIGRSGTRNVC